MLNEHTLDQLRSLRLDGMLRAIEEQATSASADELGFDERLTLLVQREVAWRDDRRVARLLKAAKLKVAGACIEEINWRASRGLDRGVVTALAGEAGAAHALPRVARLAAPARLRPLRRYAPRSASSVHPRVRRRRSNIDQTYRKSAQGRELHAAASETGR